MSSKAGYAYRVEMLAPHSRTTVAMGRAGVRIKSLENDVAVVRHYVYGQESVEQAKATLIADLPHIRKVAGVNLSKLDVEQGFESKLFRFERIAH